MDWPKKSIGMLDVEHAIEDRFRRLRFKPEVERQFEADVADDRCHHMIQQNYIGLVIYHSFLYGDYHVVGDAFRFDLLMHFVVMTPLMIATNFVLARKPPVWLREGLETLALSILTLTIALVASASRLADRDIILLTIVLVILFATIMQRLRFWYVVVSCLTSQIYYSLGLTTIVPFSANRTIMSNSVFAGILVFALVGSYNLEYEQRLGYLLRLRDRLRNRELETISNRDALTGTGNRRALDATFIRLQGASLTESYRSVAVLLLDIDHFKIFNDTNGHQEGDICLKRVASLVAASLRDAGSLYRFGGEEFLVLLEDTALEEALIVAERIRLTLASTSIARNPTDAVFVTVSVGVAAGVLGFNVTPDILIAAADAALYTSKHKGRNQVSSYVDQTQASPRTPLSSFNQTRPTYSPVSDHLLPG